MKTTLSPQTLTAYVGRQIEAFFPDGKIEREDLKQAVDHGLDRLAHCFAHVRLKYYQVHGEPTYDHLHTDQHAALLYLVSRVLHAEIGNSRLAAKIYALNKALHGLDVFYEVELPAVFYLQHPVGTVLGRAVYNDYLAVYQGVTVGADLDGEYPVLEEGVVLFGGSRVIGRSRIGANTWLAPGGTVLNASFPGDSILFGQPPETGRRPARRDVVRDFFHRPAPGDGP